MRTEHKKTRIKNGLREFLYGGYVTWRRPDDSIDTREIRVWGPFYWDPDQFSDGKEIMEAVQEKARKRWPKAECREVWRY